MTKQTTRMTAAMMLLGVVTIGACATDASSVDEPETSEATAAVTTLKLTGTVHTTNRSGVQSITTHTLGNASDATYALWGIAGQEKSDEPCWLHVKTENINDQNDKVGKWKDTCGGSSGDLLTADFADTDFTGPKAFVSGVKVCLNSSHTKVKGWTLYARELQSDGTLVDLSNSALAGPRPNCADEMARVNCPTGEIATAAVLDFTTAVPGDWTGISLKCRAVAPI